MAKSPSPTISFPKELVNPHPLVELTKNLLLKSKPEEKGLIEPEQVNRLNVLVSPQQITRAMLISDTLLKAFEARGWKVRIEKEGKCCTTIIADDESIAFSIREQVTRTPHEPTPAERREMERRRYFHDVPNYDFTPTGRLAVTIGQTRRADTERGRIDDKLNQFIDDVSAAAALQKKRRIEHEEWERQREAQRAQEAQAQYERYEEQSRRRTLNEEVDAWDRFHRTIHYINTIEGAAYRAGAATDPTTEIGKWIVWARKYARDCNPIPARFAQWGAPLTSDQQGLLDA